MDFLRHRHLECLPESLSFACTQRYLLVIFLQRKKIAKRLEESFEAQKRTEHAAFLEEQYEKDEALNAQHCVYAVGNGQNG